MANCRHLELPTTRLASVTHRVRRLNFPNVVVTCRVAEPLHGIALANFALRANSRLTSDLPSLIAVLGN